MPERGRPWVATVLNSSKSGSSIGAMYGDDRGGSTVRRLLISGIGASVSGGVMMGVMMGMSVDGRAQAQSPANEPPGKPVGLRLVGAPRHDAVALEWDDPDDDSITGYRILRRNRAVDDAGEFHVHLNNTGTAATSYLDTDVVAETRYVYRIKAINEHGLSVQSTYVNADTPSPPVPDQLTELTGTVEHDSVSLSWDDPGDSSITGYQVLRRNRAVDDKGVFHTVTDDTGSADTSYEDTTVEPETRYSYRVAARNSAGLSPTSGYFEADVPVADPDGTLSEAIDLGDITDQENVIFRSDSVDGTSDRLDYYRFTLTEAREVGLGLREQEGDGDLHLEDGDGNVVSSSEGEGSVDEWILDIVGAGTYYIRVEAQESRVNNYGLRYEVSPPAQEQQQPTPTPDNSAESGQPGSTSSDSTCPDPQGSPTPTPVTFDAVPIVVPSTTDEYFALYATFDVDGETWEMPVAVTLGEAGTTTLSENVEALPAERYRVEKYLVADPGDVDGDCVDDITELADLGSMNPVNPAAAIDLTDGAVAVPDQATFDALAFDKSNLKFVLLDMDTARPRLYFINTETHTHHRFFQEAVGLEPFQSESPTMLLGTITYDVNLMAPGSSLGAYYYIKPSDYYSFLTATRTHTMLAASMPLLENNLAAYLPNSDFQDIQSALPLLRASRISLLFDEDIYGEIPFLALNSGEGYGRLQALEPGDRPHPRDIVLYEALPNELPRVAGIVTTVPQTLLSHVNLRAIQDGIPNAYIRESSTTLTSRPSSAASSAMR